MKIILCCVLILFFSISSPAFAQQPARQWEIQSIDTMKMSRDLAKEKLNDASFDAVIDKQVQEIAQTGATHIAIATPYDSEFIPFLKRWVHAARKYHIKVWFRGNFSGWEKWFDYKAITPVQHTRMLKSFIENNPDIFEDGDLFSSCPECENGGTGDPRKTKQITAYRRFLIQEYNTAQSSFAKIGKKVDPSFFSMNADVARLIMNPETARQLGQIVVIDHYVKDPEKMAKDIGEIHEQSKADVFLGEFGAPIPDIHGNMTEKQQADWIQRTLQMISWTPGFVGANYWVNTGGSTQLWNKNGSARPAQQVLKKFYTSEVIKGTIRDEIQMPVGGVEVNSMGVSTTSDDAGHFYLPYIPKNEKITFTSKTFDKKQIASDGKGIDFSVTLTKKKEPWWFHTLKTILDMLKKL